MVFPTTRGSVVAALASDERAVRDRAFDALAGIYWKPLYKYARLAHRLGPDDAEDLTQSFLATAFEKNSIASFDAAKAAFRTFLRLLFDRHIANELKAAGRQKRGGGTARVDPADVEAELVNAAAPSNPEEYFHAEWVRSVFETAVERVRSESNPVDFAIFSAYDLENDEQISYELLSRRFSLPVTTITNRLAATRKRFRTILLDLVREITATEAEFRNEIRALVGVEQ